MGCDGGQPSHVKQFRVSIDLFGNCQKVADLWPRYGEIDSITDSIKAHMDAEGVYTISGTDWKVTYKAVTSSRIDTSALKKALPDVVERFSKTSTARRFCIA